MPYHIHTSKALRYDTCYTRNHTVLPATKHKPYHTCLYAAATEHHRPLAVAHFPPSEKSRLSWHKHTLLKVASNWTRVGTEPATCVVRIQYSTIRLYTHV